MSKKARLKRILLSKMLDSQILLNFQFMKNHNIANIVYT